MKLSLKIICAVGQACLPLSSHEIQGVMGLNTLLLNQLARTLWNKEKAS